MIESIRATLRNTPFSDSPIVPTSIVTGRGLDELKSALAHVLAKTAPPRDIGKPRLPVDRVFNLKGIGTVVTGTLTGGALRRGQNIVIQPSGKTARIRSIQSHNRDVEISGPGTRTALNLPNLIPHEDIRRGDVVTLSEFGEPSKTLDVLLEISPRAKRALKQDARVRVHHGSGNVPARVAFFAAKKLAAGERALAQLRLEAPAFVFAGDRFVVRDWAEQDTLAGGIVLDADASNTSFRSEARMANFSMSAPRRPEDVQAYILSQLMRDGAARRVRAASKVAVQCRRNLLNRFQARCRRCSRSRRRFCRRYREVERTLSARDHVIDSWHRAHPEDAGMSLTDLRSSLEADLPFADLFDVLIKDLCKSEFVQTGAVIRRATHRPTMSAQLQAAASKLRRRAGCQTRLTRPRACQLAPDPVSQQALRFLIKPATPSRSTRKW